MNKSRSYKNQNFRAQAIMEFTLALPILLLLVYGVLETGRLLFIYSSTITAAREAARYGSATGDSPNGMPYYNDCDGITAAAQKTGFINTFESINISYDKGLDSTGNPVSPIANCGSLTPVNGDRVVVEVTTQWEPIVPLVPLKAFTIKSQSERTIFASISVNVGGENNAGGENPGGQDNGILELTVNPSSTTYNTAYKPSTGEGAVDLTFTLTNANNATAGLTKPFTITTTINGTAATTTCASAPASLSIGASHTCSEKYTYQITQSDMDVGSFTSSSVATASTATSGAEIITFTGIREAKLLLSFDPSPELAGNQIAYTYKLTNTGNVTLSNPIVNLIGPTVTDIVNCTGSNSLLPGNSVDCTSLYTTKQADITAGTVVNNATATATPPTGLPAPVTAASAAVVTRPVSLSVTTNSPEPLYAGNNIYVHTTKQNSFAN